MALPKVVVSVSNGGLEQTLTLNDGVSAVIATGVAVTGKFTLGTAYLVNSLAEATNTLGLDASTNAHLYGIIAEFFATVGGTTPLYVMGVASTVTMEQMLTNSNSYVKDLDTLAEGNIGLFGVSRQGTAASMSGELDADVDKAMIAGQATAEAYAKKMQPFRFVVDGKNFTGTVGSLKSYSTATYNRGAIFLTNKSGETNTRIGLILGSLAKLPVQRKISRVKNGPVPITYEPYMGAQRAETLIDSWESIHDKGYIFLRTYQGKTGYYFSSDVTCTASTDDYSSLSNGRVIDKAIVIAYSTCVNELNDDGVLVGGKIPVPLVKSMESSIERAITSTMGLDAISEVKASIDEDQNIVSTGALAVSLVIVPVGYKKNINITLGFALSINI